MIGLGCMRLDSAETIVAALEAGVGLLDTARAYGDSEQLVADALRMWKGPRPIVVTKGGMGEQWKPDGRAKKIAEDCERSLQILGRIDLYLLHAPDPNVDLATSVRALAKLPVGTIGLSNVSLKQLREAQQIAPIAAVQNALGAFHHGPFRDGIVKSGVTVQAHTPFGGVKRAAKLANDAVLRKIAERHGATAQQVVLSWLADGGIVPLPGARRPETARGLKVFSLDEQDRAELDAWCPPAARAWRPKPTRAGDGEIVLIMGIPGAGKSTHVREWVERGYERLNRDERGGTLRGLALHLDERLDAGARRVVLDNTYVTRASRDQVLEIAEKHGLPVRCVWLDTPLEQAQVNVLERGRDDGMLPTSMLRMVRQFEEPAADEGFSQIDRVPFVRQPVRDRPGLIVSLDALPRVTEWTSPALVIAWRPKQTPTLPAGVELAVCEHEGGPPVCWCRPPLPGLAIAWAKKHGVSFAKTRFIAASAADEKMAAALGCTR